MVFFVCESCNETLKRNQVEKHRCHGGYTCVDCSVTFYGEGYKAHATCVSEAEKYEGALYKKKEQKKSPQDIWMDALNNAVADAAKAPDNIRNYLPRLIALGNVPRNKSKFFNFVKNSLKIFNESVITAMWDFLEVTAKKDMLEIQEKSQKVKQDSKKKKVVETNNSDEKTDSPIESSEEKKAKKAQKKEDKKRKAHEESIENISIVDATNVDSTLIDEPEQKKKKKKSKKNSRDQDDDAAAVIELEDELPVSMDIVDTKESEKARKKAKKEAKKHRKESHEDQIDSLRL